MAHVQLSPLIGFHARSSKDAPGFGFGLGSSNMSSQSWTTSPFQSTQASTLNQLASTSLFTNATHRPQKRRHEPEESENYRQDEVMDRSPTPERPKRAAPKRLRTIPSDSASKEDGTSTDSSSRHATEDKDIDIGVLLATLPPQSLLPILTSLIRSQPSLKSAILPLIPHPTVETATQALAESSKKLREAYPYSNNNSFSTSTSLGFGFGTGSGSSGMSESYIQSRLRPHINEFVSTFTSYLPYFTYRSAASSPSTLSTQNKPHPTEVFFFLSNVTGHILSQPQLAQNGIEPLLLSKLSEEWNAWVARVDVVVNREGGMFGSDTVHGWVQRLDEFAAKDSQIGHVMRGVRDQWIGRVGWLVGRTHQHPMES
ncbi:hypothetical protein F5879DRAFT_873403 [Lentinula edodes]|nr:hypothetical protein HHX47_DHR1001629 [Lentinula edodes]KAJ3908622.1 hypothetical protein F5879DRAFT_873403 [Lentinula edodes]KAJ3918289.1 hypothetical protein F5877DRAFT_67475 [Lentinula edodes]